MTPIKPHWRQPSHPSIQRVVASSADFTTKSFSRVTLSPYAVFAKMTLPPCTIAPKASYDTVQIAADKHLLLNSDLLYINHSCEPSLVSEPGDTDERSSKMQMEKTYTLCRYSTLRT